MNDCRSQNVGGGTFRDSEDPSANSVCEMKSMKMWMPNKLNCDMAASGLRVLKRHVLYSSL